jgi:hypothetical protein
MLDIRSQTLRSVEDSVLLGLSGLDPDYPVLTDLSLRLIKQTQNQQLAHSGMLPKTG